MRVAWALICLMIYVSPTNMLIPKADVPSTENSVPILQSVKPPTFINFTKLFNINVNRRFEELHELMEPVQPVRGPDFDPSWGYEPYWKDGNYYFDRFKQNVTTPKVTLSPQSNNTMCGMPCPEMYFEYGVICAKNSNMTHKTFKNYCELRDEDCTDHEKWTIIYRGACQPELKTYPPHGWHSAKPTQTQTDRVKSRAQQYIEDFKNRYSTTPKILNKTQA